MKKVFGILSLVIALTFTMMSCDETPVVNDATVLTATSVDSSKTEHKACEADCTKPCCAAKEIKKCCKGDGPKNYATDSATCAAMKEKCHNECGTDSTICETHKAECKAKCAAKTDSTAVSSCKADCTKPCCSDEEKKACKADCEKECCADKK